MEKSGTTIRVVAIHSGSAHVAIKGSIEKQFAISFGLVSARMAAALGTIAAAKLIAHEAGTKQNVFVSTGNLDFARYGLREREPRDKEMRIILEHMWQTLNQFNEWSLSYYPSKRHKLHGSPNAKDFPRGVFPWLKAEIRPVGDKIVVQPPDCPAVQKQFAASIRSAELKDGRFFVPIAAEKVVKAWLASVTSSQSEERR